MPRIRFTFTLWNYFHSKWIFPKRFNASLSQMPLALRSSVRGITGREVQKSFATMNSANLKLAVPAHTWLRLHFRGEEGGGDTLSRLSEVKASFCAPAYFCAMALTTWPFVSFAGRRRDSRQKGDKRRKISVTRK